MCRSGCATQDHASWGECLRAANVQVGPPDVEGRKRWDAGLQGYADARRQGMQPQMPTFDSVEKTKREVGA